MKTRRIAQLSHLFLAIPGTQTTHTLVLDIKDHRTPNNSVLSVLSAFQKSALVNGFNLI